MTDVCFSCEELWRFEGKDGFKRKRLARISRTRAEEEAAHTARPCRKDGSKKRKKKMNKIKKATPAA
jgi:hypothetical protein